MGSRLVGGDLLLLCLRANRNSFRARNRILESYNDRGICCVGGFPNRRQVKQFSRMKFRCTSRYTRNNRLQDCCSDKSSSNSRRHSQRFNGSGTCESLLSGAWAVVFVPERLASLPFSYPTCRIRLP